MHHHCCRCHHCWHFCEKCGNWYCCRCGETQNWYYFGSYGPWVFPDCEYSPNYTITWGSTYETDTNCNHKSRKEERKDK